MSAWYNWNCRNRRLPIFASLKSPTLVILWHPYICKKWKKHFFSIFLKICPLQFLPFFGQTCPWGWGTQTRKKLEYSSSLNVEKHRKNVLMLKSLISTTSNHLVFSGYKVGKINDFENTKVANFSDINYRLIWNLVMSIGTNWANVAMTPVKVTWCFEVLIIRHGKLLWPWG